MLMTPRAPDFVSNRVAYPDPTTARRRWRKFRLLHAKGTDEAAAADREAVSLVVPQRVRRRLADTAHVRSDDVAVPRDVDRAR
jgi:hypothetical protein